MDLNIIIIILLVILVVAFLICGCFMKKRKETYSPIANTAGGNYNNGIRQSARSDNSVFGNRYNAMPITNNRAEYQPEGIRSVAKFPWAGRQQQNFVQQSQPNVDYANMGGDYEIISDPIPIGDRRDQLLDPRDLLPAMDMTQNFARDTSDPTNFMYDRPIQAPSRRRRGNITADFFRGDLYIEPRKSGPDGAWFQVSADPETDLVKGYFSNFTDSSQIQMSHQGRDMIYRTALDNMMS